MIISNEHETMEWKVLQYQYPEEELSTPTNYSYNANWLKIQVSHEREGYGPAVFRESFLMTYELKDLIQELRKLHQGDGFYYKAEFVEPILEVEVSRQRETFSVCFDLYFDNYEMMVARNMTEDELLDLIQQLEAMLAAFPER